MITKEVAIFEAEKGNTIQYQSKFSGEWKDICKKVNEGIVWQIINLAKFYYKLRLKPKENE